MLVTVIIRIFKQIEKYFKMINKILKWVKCYFIHRPVLSGRYETTVQGITNHKVECTLCGCTSWATYDAGPK